MGVNVGIVFCVVFLLAIQAMGVHEGVSSKKVSGKIFKKKRPRLHSLPIKTAFKFPIKQSAWPPGNGFASGTLDLGGLQVYQASIFTKIWRTYDGGFDDVGFSIYEPSKIPQGFSMIGSFCQPNNKPLFGWVLVAKDVSSNSTNSTLKNPTDYTLVFNTSSLKVKQDSPLYVWLPTPPDGYKAVGHVVTTTQDKPSLDKIKCVRSDLTDQCESYVPIWGHEDFTFYLVRPSNRGVQAPGVQVGTFVAQKGGINVPPSISCLKNLNGVSKIMPNLQQIEVILNSYSPVLYLHPNEEYLPSSIDWFFSNGALLYKKGQESNPVSIAPNGTNLPQDPNNDGAYWIDLPADDENKERVKKGNLSSAESYVHVKPMLGGTFTDFAMWVFYPFNGPARAKVEFVDIKFGSIGEHVGDWEHVKLRVSNLDGQLWSVYFSEHSKGTWVGSSLLKFQTISSFDFPTKRPVVYSSLHGHASYPNAGLVLQGKDGVGVRDDCDDGGKFMDMGKFVLISAEYLGSNVTEPAWLNFSREWGPHIDYSINEELKQVEKLLLGWLRKYFEKLVNSLPPEVLGEEGPTGPKEKNNWNGDEV